MKNTHSSSKFKLQVPNVKTVGGNGNIDNVEDIDDEDDLDDDDVNHIQPNDVVPSVSPRDKLSYLDDRKTWKDCAKFRTEQTSLDVLLMLMHRAILKDKPVDIVSYLATDFYADCRHIELRRALSKQ
jgi:hypothetical protein